MLKLSRSLSGILFACVAVAFVVEVINTRNKNKENGEENDEENDEKFYGEEFDDIW